MVIKAVGWSEDMRWGQPSPGVPDLISRVTQMWSSLCPLFPEWRMPLLALPAPCGRTGTQDCSRARRARPEFAHPWEQPGDLQSGASVSQAPLTPWTPGQVAMGLGLEVSYKPCVIKKR